MDRPPPSHHEIELLAYRFWHERGCPWGTPETDWFPGRVHVNQYERRHRGPCGGDWRGARDGRGRVFQQLGRSVGINAAGRIGAVQPRASRLGCGVRAHVIAPVLHVKRIAAPLIPVAERDNEKAQISDKLAAYRFRLECNGPGTSAQDREPVPLRHRTRAKPPRRLFSWKLVRTTNTYALRCRGCWIRVIPETIYWSDLPGKLRRSFWTRKRRRFLLQGRWSVRIPLRF